MHRAVSSAGSTEDDRNVRPDGGLPGHGGEDREGEPLTYGDPGEVDHERVGLGGEAPLQDGVDPPGGREIQ